ncbi:hypothetical protein C8F01DRAFT_1099551 [Mycena amicta]|nr:hypothetical protein C8F01DRAFT_1099551 [Mycena amicta]
MSTTRTPASRPSALLNATNRAQRVQRPRESLRRSSNIFFRRDSLADSDDEADFHADRQSPAKKPRPSYVWDNEDTLVSALVDEDSNTTDPNAKFVALADSLQENFNRKGTIVLHDMAHTLQPAVQRIQHTHRTLERHIDPMYTTGLLAFDDAAKAFESLDIEDQRVLQREYTATKERIKDLFSHLEDAYSHREKLWSDLEAGIAAKVDPTIAALAEVPAATERTISSLEKHAKTLAAKDDDAAAADKIRGMLSKLV